MRTIDLAFRTLYSELAQRCLDQAFVSEFSTDGRFVSALSRGRRYWYYDASDGAGGRRRRYVGREDDPEVTRRVQEFKELKGDVRARRKLVSTLVREARLPRPDPVAGDVVRALADAGLFRLRAVLVGTVAFGVYPALLGVRMPEALGGTGDVDVAQFNSISASVEDATPPMLDVLRSVDATFRELPHASDGRRSTRFRSASGFLVEFLTPNTGSDDREGRPASMPALGGASAEPLRFLDFAIRDPVRAVLLHGSGVPVLVPAPERFAVHKMIVASRRRATGDGAAKVDKDRRQAAELLRTMLALRLHEDLAEAWIEAWDRGAAWRSALKSSLGTFEKATREQVLEGLSVGVRGLGCDPSTYGLADRSAASPT